MPSIVAIVGTQNTGKTTLVEKLVSGLRQKGYRVATAKSAYHATFDQPGKDSWRHIEAGSQATVISMHGRLVLIKPVAEEPGIDEITRQLGEDYDIILAEGFKQGRAPKIEVHRREAGPPLSGVEGIVAIASDEPLETDLRQFDINDAGAIVDFLEAEFIPADEQRMSLYINDMRVPLKEFPYGIIRNIILGIVASLNGVGKLKSLALFLGKKDS